MFFEKNSFEQKNKNKNKIKKIRAELNEIEARSTVEQINKTRSWFLKELIR